MQIIQNKYYLFLIYRVFDSLVNYLYLWYSKHDYVTVLNCKLLQSYQWNLLSKSCIHPASASCFGEKFNLLNPLPWGWRWMHVMDFIHVFSILFNFLPCMFSSIGGLQSTAICRDKSQRLDVFHCHIFPLITYQAYTSYNKEKWNKNRISTAENRKWLSTVVRYDILHMWRISYLLTVEWPIRLQHFTCNAFHCNIQIHISQWM